MTTSQAVVIAIGFVGAVMALGMGCGLIAEWLRERKRAPAICADTGAPKDPRGCWNVRCQLGNKCCRVDGVLGKDGGRGQ